jgi:gamma-glutamyltranspeptidase/glutathione hydrolase
VKILRTILWSTALLLIWGQALGGDKQVAGPPAADRRFQTRPAVPGLHGLVVAGHPIAASAGLQILLKGGNAFDAAVTVGVMIPLGEPEMNDIGGNGFVTLYDKKSGQVLTLSMTGGAPKGIKPADMTPEALDNGINAGIVPGNLGGYLYLLDRFGTMSISEVFAPVDPMLAADIDGLEASLSKYPTTAKIFLPGGQPLKAGDLFKNPDYANTLRKLVEAEEQAKAHGASRSAAIKAAYDRFYKGDIAREFDRFFRENGGVMRASDLADYNPEWREPLHTAYRGYDVYSNPSTSRGGFEVLMQANVVEGFDLRSFGPESAKTLHAEIEAIKIAKADVYRYVADPKFTTIPTAGMLSKDYAAKRRELTDMDKAGPYPGPGTPAGATTSARLFGAQSLREKYDAEQHTTSFSVVDRFGNGVSITPTLGNLFGSQVVVGNTGLLLNDGMRLGSTSPYPTDVNYVAPGKIPLLNNSPLVVLKDGKLAFVFGSPGGETIGQTEFQLLVNLIDFNIPVQKAIEAPRFALVANPNFYKPGAEITVQVESRVPTETIAALKAMGHEVVVVPGWGSIGNLQAIRVDLNTGAMTAGADPRRTMYAMGY